MLRTSFERTDKELLAHLEGAARSPKPVTGGAASGQGHASSCVRKDVMASALFLGQACRHGKAYPALVLTGRGPLLVFRLPHVTRFPDRLQAFQAPACADRGMLAQVMVPTDERPQEGQLALSVELSALCSPDARPGRFSEAANCLNEQARVAAQRPQVASAQVC